MLEVSLADFDDVRLAAFLREHLADLAPTAPVESQHALDLTALRQPSVRLWVARESEAIVGTVALAGLSNRHEELKSMRTAPARRGAGIASRLLEHALQDARSRGVTRVSLETGSMEFFAPARRLYRKAGFADCAPFGSYVEDPNSVYLTREL
ncbi:GNAT family N-acetyltransferase [Amycolatopsis benzoatilytica]|uniref:GNAT family N-acetyltransferase n=1 Tax=Amycolatopsis benzoatilytica TaxID=346045 RepID=UPI00036E1196|nr:GNAT family N-acetyltransferase [Amycolatopsis benzoatilytica]